MLCLVILGSARFATREDEVDADTEADELVREPESDIARAMATAVSSEPDGMYRKVLKARCS